MNNVIPRHEAVVDLPERHRVPGAQLFPGGFADRRNLCLGSSITLYLAYQLNLPYVEDRGRVPRHSPGPIAYPR